MNLSEEDKEDITDMVIESRDIEEDLTTVYLKGYADAEEKYRKKIKEQEEALLKVKDKNTTLFITCRNSIPKQKVKEIILKIINYKIPRAVNNGYYYDYFVNQEYKEDFVKLFNKLLEDK